MAEVRSFIKKGVNGYYPGIAGKKVIIWGISFRAAKECKTIMFYGGDVVGFTDSFQIEKTEKLFCGLPIYSLSDIEKMKDEVTFVIATRQFEFILKITNKMKELHIYESYVWGHQNIVRSFETLPVKKLMERDNKIIKEVYGFLTDEVSRKVFRKRMEFLLTGEQECMLGVYTENEAQYFPASIISLQKDEVFIDAGACCGETTEELLQYTKGKCKKAYLFEPNKKILDVAKEIFQFSDYENIEFFYGGLYDTNRKIGFNDEERIGVTNVSEKFENKIEVVSLDEFMKDKNEKVTFIKMDIEGSEKEALIGASHIIKTELPKLAICVYHKYEDLWEIPYMIKQFSDQYDIYLRHHSASNTETVCYAVKRDKTAKVVMDILDK